MIDNIKDLKELLLWAKTQKVKSIKLKNVEFELSDLAFLSDEDFQSPEKVEKLLEEANKSEIDDETLFWSSN